MEVLDEIRRLLDNQRAGSLQLEQAIARLQGEDILQQNARLQAESQHYREVLAGQAAELEHLRRENQALRQQRTAPVPSQQDGTLHTARQQTDALFDREEGAARDRLAAHSKEVNTRLLRLREELAGQEQWAGHLLAQMGELERRAQEELRQAAHQAQQRFAQQREEAHQGYDQLAHAAQQAQQPQQPSTPPPTAPQNQSTRKLRQNSLELKVGEKLTVVVGVFFMLLAVIFGLRYSYVYLLKSDILKGLVAYLISGLFLAAGELMARRRRTPFSVAISAGGVAMLFASTAVSYFTLGIMPVPVAVGLCVGITALALWQSLRHDAQVIAVFALLGGYLPIRAVDLNTGMILSGMAYFFLLNLFVLLVALRKQWQPLKLCSQIFSVISTGYLLYLLYALGEGGAHMATGIVYLVALFLLYMITVLGYPILRQGVLRRSDTVLLGLNTAFTAGFLFSWLSLHGYGDVAGSVTLGFSLLFFLFARGLRRVLEQDAGARGLFYATSLTFWILTVPLLLESRLTSLGWLIQAVVLWGFGTLTDRKWYRRAGQLIWCLCLTRFVLLDILADYLYYRGLFVWQYGAITVGAVAILAVTLYRHPAPTPFWQTGEGRVLGVFRWMALGNVWLYGRYLLGETLPTFVVWGRFWHMLAAAVLTLGLGALYRAVVPLRSRSVDVLSQILLWLGLCNVVLLNAFTLPSPSWRSGLAEVYNSRMVPGLWWLAGLMALLAVSAVAVYLLFYLLRTRYRVSDQRVVLSVSLFGLFLVLQVLLVQGQVGLRSMAVSFVLMAWALSAIVFGFVRRYPVLRRAGLGLSLLSITKLFLLDLYFLQSGQKILSYFVFGAVFIAIGYLYQQFSRKLLVPENFSTTEAPTVENFPATPPPTTEQYPSIEYPPVKYNPTQPPPEDKIE